MDWHLLNAQERNAIWFTYRLAEFIIQQYPDGKSSEDWAWFAAKIVERTDEQALSEIELLSRATKPSDPRYFYLISVRYGPVARLCSHARTLRTSSTLKDHAIQCFDECREIMRLLKPAVEDLPMGMDAGAGAGT